MLLLWLPETVCMTENVCLGWPVLQGSVIVCCCLCCLWLRLLKERQSSKMQDYQLEQDLIPLSLISFVGKVRASWFK